MSRYDDLIALLARKSVEKRYEAYADIDWAPIELEDPRWSLHPESALGATRWYRELPEHRQALLGLDHRVQQMRLGAAFENILSRGLLEFCAQLPNGAPEYRYAMHEIVEEGQHQMMFQEFVNRSGRDPVGLPAFERFMSRRVVRYGRTFPELFFIFVLGGEAPIDYVQRQELKRGGLHPLFERITRIHVTEEARHLCFANAWLRKQGPELSTWKRLRMSLSAPLLSRDMASTMLRPGKQVIRRHGIPQAVLIEAVERQRPLLQQAVRPVAELCDELGLITPITRPLWGSLAPTAGGAR